MPSAGKARIARASTSARPRSGGETPSTGPLLGSMRTLREQREEVLEQFFANTKLYPESRYPGAKAVMRAVLEQGLAHVTDGTKPAYMGFEEIKGDDQPDIAGALTRINAGRQLSPEFAVVTYRANQLCTGADASFIINRNNMRATIKAHEQELGLPTQGTGTDNFLQELISGRSNAFKDQVKLGILLGLGAQNSRNYAERSRRMKEFEADFRAKMQSQGRSFDEDEFNAQFNAKTSEITDSFGTTETGRNVALASFDMDITLPRPWLGTLWDSKETKELAQASLAETKSIDNKMRQRHANRCKQDAQASYADTLIEHISNRLYLPKE
jgi:hypothetical protein